MEPAVHAIGKCGELKGQAVGRTDINECAVGLDAADNALQLQTDGHILEIESESIPSVVSVVCDAL